MLKKNIIAGFIATTILSILMIAKSNAELLPQLDPIKDLWILIDRVTGLDLPIVTAWAAHFFIGTVIWGTLYNIISRFIPGCSSVKGMFYGIILWLLMMIIFMPAVGAGLFATKLGANAILMSLELHILYGIVFVMISNGSYTCASNDNSCSHISKSITSGSASNSQSNSRTHF